MENPLVPVSLNKEFFPTNETQVSPIAPFKNSVLKGVIDEPCYVDLPVTPQQCKVEKTDRFKKVTDSTEDIYFINHIKEITDYTARNSKLNFSTGKIDFSKINTPVPSEIMILTSLADEDISSKVKYVKVKLKDNAPYSALIDTGSSANIMGYGIFSSNFPNTEIVPVEITLRAYSGHTSSAKGKATVNLRIGGQIVEQNFIILDDDIHSGMILGSPFLRDLKCVIHFSENFLTSPLLKKPVPFNNLEFLNKDRLIKSADDYTIEPGQELTIETIYHIKDIELGSRMLNLPPHTTGLIKGLPPSKYLNSKSEPLLHSLTGKNIYHTDSKGKLNLKFMNETNSPIKIPKFKTLATFTPVENTDLDISGLQFTDKFQEVQKEFDYILNNPYNYDEILKQKPLEVDPIFDLDNKDCILSDDGKKIVKYILAKNRKAFQIDKSTDKLGCFKGMEFNVDLFQNSPFWKCNPYFPSIKDKEDYLRILKEQEDMGIIERAQKGELFSRVNPWFIISRKIPIVKKKKSPIDDSFSKLHNISESNFKVISSDTFTNNEGLETSCNIQEATEPKILEKSTTAEEGHQKRKLPKKEVEGVDYYLKKKPCTDLRFLNLFTKDWVNFPMYTMDQIINTAANKVFFSAFDASMGYLQLPLSDRSQKDAAIITSEGVFRQKRACYGLSQMPMVWSQIMSIILEFDKNDDNVFAKSFGSDCVPYFYLDDIFLGAFDEHTQLRQIEFVVRRAAAAGYTLAGAKTFIGRKKLVLLGFVVENNGEIKPPDSKIDEIINAQHPNDPVGKPQKLKSLQSFLGSVNYLSRFGPHVQQLIRPLQDNLKKDFWIWGEEQEAAFEKTKELISERMSNHFPNLSKPFHLFTDASGSAISWVLCQKHSYPPGSTKEDPISRDRGRNENDDLIDKEDEKAPTFKKNKNSHLYIVQCGGRSLTEFESRLAGIYDKEFLAIISGLRAFEKILKYSIQTFIYCDNKPLCEALKSKIPFSQKIISWQVELSTYKFVIKHVVGLENVLADKISRLPEFYLKQIDGSASPGMDSDELLDLLANKTADVDSNLKKMAFSRTVSQKQKLFNDMFKESDSAPSQEEVDKMLEKVDLDYKNSLAKKTAENVSKLKTDSPVKTGKADLTVNAITRSQNLGKPVGVEKDTMTYRKGGTPKDSHNSSVGSARNTQETSLPKEMAATPEHADPVEVQRAGRHKSQLPTISENYASGDQENEQFTESNDTDFVDLNDHVPQGVLFDREKILFDDISASELIKHQRSDPFFGPLIRYLESSERPSDEYLSENNFHTLRNFQSFCSEFEVVADILLKFVELNRKRKLGIHFPVCIPQKLENTILGLSHSSPGNFGLHQKSGCMYSNYRRICYFRNMLKKMQEYAKSCIICNQASSTNFRQTVESNITSRPSGVLERVSIDYLGPVNPGSGEFNYIVVMIDVFTHYLYLLPVKDTTADNFVKCMTHFIASIGKPDTILTDRASNFCSSVTDNLAKIFGIKHIKILASNHRANAYAEAYVKKTKYAISKFCASNPSSWADYLDLVVFAHNNSIQTDFSSETPYYLMHGFKKGSFPNFCLPHDLQFLEQNQDLPLLLYSKYQNVVDIYREEMDAHLEKGTKKFNRSLNKLVTPEIGNLVFVLNNMHLGTKDNTTFSNSAMSLKKWIGPCIVGYLLKKSNRVVGAGLLDEFLNPIKFHTNKDNMVSVRRLKVVPVRVDGKIITKIPLNKIFSLTDWQHISVKDRERQKLSSGLADRSHENVALKPGYFLIEKILDSDYDNTSNSLRFLVRWKNFDSESDSWISENDLLDKNLIFQYFMARAGAKKKDFKELG